MYQIPMFQWNFISIPIYIYIPRHTIVLGQLNQTHHFYLLKIIIQYNNGKVLKSMYTK